MTKLKSIKDKLFSNKKLLAIILSSLIIGGLAIFFYYYYSNDTKANNSLMINQYQEEVVTMGDIVVGVTESGTASMNTTDISLGYSTTITEAYVKSGQFVTEGTALLKIDLDEYNSAYSDVQSELDSALISLSDAQLNGESQKLSLEKAYNEKVYYGENAQEIYDNSINDIADGLVDLQEQRDELNDKYNDTHNELNILVNANTALNTAKEKYEALDEHFKIDCTDYISAQELNNDKNLENDISGDTVLSCGHTYADHENSQTIKTDYDTAQLTLNKLVGENSTYEKEVSSLQTQMSDIYTSITEIDEQIYSYDNDTALKSLQATATYNENVYDGSAALSEYTIALQEIENNITKASNNVEKLQDELDNFTTLSADGIIYAPCDGYMMNIASENDSLNANGSLATIAENGEVNISVSIAQEDISQISIDMPANIIFDAYDEFTIPAVVDSISVSPSGGMQTTVNYTVNLKCDVSAFNGVVIYEGMTSSVTFIQAQEQDVLIISNKCITSENGNQYVKTINANGDIESVMVQTGFSDGFDVEIISGLNEGDVVIIESAVMQNAS